MKPVSKSAVAKSAVRVLVLDDDPFMLQLIARMLHKQGYPLVTACRDGQAALERVDEQNGHPDLILCDLKMPQMDGVEFVRELVKRGYAGSLIPFSGAGDRLLQAAEKVARAHGIRVLGHLNKPFSPEQLETLVETWAPVLAGKSAAPRKIYDEHEIRAAIEQCTLINHYQPIVDLASGHVVGVEALVRWPHPQDGMVMPDQFIGVAERSDLIDELTRVVLSAALADVATWARAGLGLRVTVNLSMRSLVELAFPDLVAAQVAAAGLAPRDLVMEVTESGLMDDLPATLEVLTRLSLKHFRLSIDDFGTGNSSLAKLRDIPFDELKVDRGFVHNAWADKTVRAIYDASLGLAKQLGMETVAEGVEDLDDWNFVRQSGCDLAQGYFIARPMAPAEVVPWIGRWRERAVQELGLDDDAGGA